MSSLSIIKFPGTYESVAILRLSSVLHALETCLWGRIFHSYFLSLARYLISRPLSYHIRCHVFDALENPFVPCCSRRVITCRRSLLQFCGRIGISRLMSLTFGRMLKARCAMFGRGKVQRWVLTARETCQPENRGVRPVRRPLLSQWLEGVHVELCCLSSCPALLVVHRRYKLHLLMVQ